MGAERMIDWIEWYRFARDRLDYPHGEAVVYANVRTVEEQNRRTLREARAA